MEKKIKKETI